MGQVCRQRRCSGGHRTRQADTQGRFSTVTQPVQEEFVAQMLNFDLIGGVSFNKGCYPGQEIAVRTHYLGKPAAPV